MDRPEDQLTYLDREGLEEYRRRDERVISIEKQIPLGASEAWHAWFTTIWEGQTGPVIVNPGEGPGRIGSVRTVRVAGLTERIVGAGVPSSSTSHDAVPSISYTLEHFAVSSYLGFVRFVPVGPDARTTRVIWNVKWTPSMAGRLLFLGGRMLAGVLKPTIRQMIRELERSGPES